MEICISNTLIVSDIYKYDVIQMEIAAVYDVNFWCVNKTYIFAKTRTYRNLMSSFITYFCPIEFFITSYWDLIPFYWVPVNVFLVSSLFVILLPKPTLIISNVL